jgi:hypothetical protein
MYYPSPLDPLQHWDKVLTRNLSDMHCYQVPFGYVADGYNKLFDLFFFKNTSEKHYTTLAKQILFIGGYN